MTRLATLWMLAATLGAQQAWAVSTAYMNYTGDRRYDNVANWNQAPYVGYIAATCYFNGSTTAVPVNPSGITLGYGGSTTSIRGNGLLYVQSSTLTLGSALTLGYSKSVANSGSLYVQGGTIVTPGINNDTQNGSSTSNWVYVSSGTLDLKNPAVSATNGSINSFINCSFTGGTVQNLGSATARALSGTAAFSNLTGTLTVNPNAAGTYTSDPLLDDTACGIIGSGTIIKSGSAMLTLSPGGVGFHKTMNLAGGLTVNTPSVTFNFELDSPGPSGVGDRIAFAGAGGLTLNAMANVDLVGSLPSTAGTYRLFDLGGAAAPDMNNFTLLTTSGPGGLTYRLAAEPGFVNLVAAAPVWRWYGNGVSPGGDGTWADTGSTWSNGSSVAPLPTGTQAVFDLPSGDVTVDSSGVTPTAGLKFAVGTTYSLSGGTVTLGGATATENTVIVESAATATLSTPVAAAAGLVKSGPGDLVLAGTGNTLGDVTVAAGTLAVSGATTFTGTIAVDQAALAFSPSGTITCPAVISGAGTVSQSGPGTVELTATNTYSGGTTVTAGTLRVGNATGALGSGNVSVSGGTLAVGIAASLAGVTVDAGGQVVLDSMASRVLDVATLAVDESTGGRVDVGGSRIQIASGADAAVIKADVLAGRGGAGDWTGTSGINSSVAAGAVAGTRGVGYRVDAGGAAILGYAAPGDANMDGAVNSLDLVLISSEGKFGSGQAAYWWQGDFNYDGVVNTLDLVAISAAGVWGTGSYLPTAPSAVPEPAGLALLALTTAACLLIRRRVDRGLEKGCASPHMTSPSASQSSCRRACS